MNEIFSDLYSQNYDQFYQDKDYNSECDLIEKIALQGMINPCDILDLGCGTGGHAKVLADRNHFVLGIDRSESMINIAARNSSRKLDFLRSDIRELNLMRTFDIVIIMFSALGYITNEQDLFQVFQKIREHIKPSGRIFFDVWYGPAVLKKKPEPRKKTFETKDGKLTRYVTGKLITGSNLCELHYQLTLCKWDGSPTFHEEFHKIRFFFQIELEQMLKKSGFDKIEFGSFPNGGKPNDGNWNIYCTAEALP